MKKSLFFLLVFFMFTLVACGGETTIEYPYEYENGTVTLVEIVGNHTVIYIEVSGYAPVPIKTKITLNNTGTVFDFIVTEHMETTVPGGTLINGDFREQLVENQDNLSAVEIVAGATLTAQALIDAIEIAKTHYNLINE
jgi:Na+-translocating ferredoxin:NAD+ oxidoreductase RnfG subunit